MLKKIALSLLLPVMLTACAAEKPRIIQATSNMPDIRVTVGMATQVEMPDQGRVQSVAVGDPSLLTAEQAGDVVSLMPKGGTGETNLIIRSRDGDGDLQVYQYRIVIGPR